MPVVSVVVTVEVAVTVTVRVVPVSVMVVGGIVIAVVTTVVDPGRVNVSVLVRCTTRVIVRDGSTTVCGGTVTTLPFVSTMFVPGTLSTVLVLLTVTT